MKRTLIARNLAIALTVALALLGFRPTLAAPQQQEVTPGIYYSEPFTLPDGNEVDFSLFLGSDGSAGFITSLTNGSDALTEYGYWDMPEAGIVGVTLTGDDDREYQTPDLIIFEQDGDTLNAIEFNTDFFGEEPFSVTLAISEEEMASIEEDAAAASASAADAATTDAATAGVGGMYTSGAVTAEDGSIGVALLYLADDGTAQGNINYFDGVSLPDVQLGAWIDNEDGTITLTLETMLEATADGAKSTAMDEPIERIYEVGAEGELVGENLTLYPLASVELSAAARQTRLYVSELLPAASSPGRVIALALASDGGAALATDYLDGEEPNVELGEWITGDDDTVTVTLLGREEQEYDEPVTIIFSVADDTLTAVEYDQALYGEEGLRLTLAPEGATSADAETAAGGGVTAPVDAEATPVESVSFTSGELPSANTPGLVMTFTFYEDGAFAAASDYMNAEPPFAEYGVWEEDADGLITVSVTGGDAGDYTKPAVFTVESQEDGSILAINEEIFGADGLLLQPDAE